MSNFIVLFTKWRETQRESEMSILIFLTKICSYHTSTMELMTRIKWLKWAALAFSLSPILHKWFSRGSDTPFTLQTLTESHPSEKGLGKVSEQCDSIYIIKLSDLAQKKTNDGLKFQIVLIKFLSTKPIQEPQHSQFTSFFGATHALNMSRTHNLRVALMSTFNVPRALCHNSSSY